MSYWDKIEIIYPELVKAANSIHRRMIKNEVVEEPLDVLHTIIERIYTKEYDFDIDSLRFFIVKSIENETMRISKGITKRVIIEEGDYKEAIDSLDNDDLDDLDLARLFVDSLVNYEFKEIPHTHKAMFLTYFINVHNGKTKWGKSYDEVVIETNVSKPTVLKRINSLLNYLSFYFINKYFTKQNNKLMKYYLNNEAFVDEANLVLQAKNGYNFDIKLLVKAIDKVLNIKLSDRDIANKKYIKVLVDDMFDKLFSFEEVKNNVESLDNLVTEYDNSKVTSYERGEKTRQRVKKRNGTVREEN